MKFIKKFSTDFISNVILFIIKIEEIYEEITTKRTQNSTIPMFKKELKKKGYRLLKHISAERFCLEFPEKTSKLVLKYYNLSKIDDDKLFYLDCLYCKNCPNKNLIPFFLEEYTKYSNLYIEQQYLCDLIANCIYVTKAIDMKDEYLSVLKSNSLYEYVWPFIFICSDFQFEEAIPFLLDIIEYGSNFLCDIADKAIRKFPSHANLKKVKKSSSFYLKDLTNKIVEKEDQILNHLIEGHNLSKFNFQINKMKTHYREESLDTVEFCQKHQKKLKKVIL